MSLSIEVGPMFSGKTTSLINAINEKLLLGENVVAVKHTIDTRFGSGADKIISHNGDQLLASATLQIISVTHLCQVKLPDNARHIYIDEGQFFPDLVEFCTKWADAGLEVAVFALDGDFHRNMFGQIGFLLPRADTIRKRKAFCSCGIDALFTKRIVSSSEQILVGGSESYIATCRQCYLKK